jgi:hypothetical protein
VLIRVSEPVLLPACELYGERVSARQLVWPDAEGRMPWHPGFAHPDLQPLLGEPPPPPPARVAAPEPPVWPLDDDPHLQVLTSRPVARDGAPVLLVVRGGDGELRLLDGASDFDSDAAVVECLHEALERDLSLADAVGALRPGQMAGRDDVAGPWQIEDE